MHTVIVQIEGIGAFRAVASDIPDLLELNRDDKADIYIVNALGTWAPAIDQWLLWC